MFRDLLDRLAAPKTPTKPREDVTKENKGTPPPKATPPPRMQPAVPRLVPRDAGSHKSPVPAVNNKPIHKVCTSKTMVLSFGTGKPWLYLLSS